MLAAAAFGAQVLSTGIGARGAEPAIIHPFGSWPLGGALDFVASPLVRWDAQWYLRIAEHGYRADVEALRGTRAFFPVYPLLVRGLGGFADAGLALLVAIAISLAAFWAGLRLLHRLTALELGAPAADATVVLLALAPFAFFFSAPYTESVFLLSSVAAVLAARRGRFGLAAVAAALASGTRPTGALLVLPLAIVYLYGPRADREPAPARGPGWRRVLPRHAPRPDVLWLALAPLGIVAFSLYLRHAAGDALAWQHVQSLFGRRATEWPTETVRQGAVAAFHALEGEGPGVYRAPILIEFAFLPLALAAIVGTFRRLPFAYGAYSVAAVLFALSSPAYAEPLRALPRYLLVVFPLSMWLGDFAARRGLVRVLAVGSAAALAVLTALFASWRPYV